MLIWCQVTFLFRYQFWKLLHNFSRISGLQQHIALFEKKSDNECCHFEQWLFEYFCCLSRYLVFTCLNHPPPAYSSAQLVDLWLKHIKWLRPQPGDRLVCSGWWRLDDSSGIWLKRQTDASPGTWMLRALPVAKAASHGLTSCSADTLEDYMGHSGAVGRCEHIHAVVEHTWLLEAPFCSNLKKKRKK